MTIRVLVADDHDAIRAGLRLMLEAADGIEVVGEAADGQVAVDQTNVLRPDVVLMDIRMPGVDGVEATRRITADGDADVLILTTFDVDEYLFGALRAGAAGFLLKSTDAPALIDAVRRVAAGDGVMAPEVTRRVIEAVGAGQRPGEGRPVARPADGAAPDDLTPRELDVLRCLGRGMSNAAIAADLLISEATVKTHVSRVLVKTDAGSRLQAGIRARDWGLV